MKKSIVTLALFFCFVAGVFSQTKTVNVDPFDKIIISPHIEVELVEGSEESVIIENAKVSMDKINVEVEGNTLRVYLDGAKTVTKSERVSSDNWKGKKSLYDGTMATAKITFKTLKNLSIRGEEVVKVKSPISQDDLKLTIYGESKVYFNELVLSELTVAIYGESYLEITNGKVDRQVYRAYGESEVNTSSMNNNETKITAYGESNFRVNVSDRLKVTCYGETKINYTGDAEVDKGIVIGEAEIRKIG
ncbi:head GIN domain-containing protein [Maribacter aestuarii]|uniref:head GIN domain-containing protein n=1 Tax=Maribacter aestuarii TaxID=1130723 RepID=UPI00248BF11C|nr:head GIN domain-containing protein [Maribacter aestuarii]